MVILYYRSPYLKRILSTNKKKNDGILEHVKLPNISPEIFQIILSYIYRGKISLEECDTSDIIKILSAAKPNSKPKNKSRPRLNNDELPQSYSELTSSSQSGESSLRVSNFLEQPDEQPDEESDEPPDEESDEQTDEESRHWKTSRPYDIPRYSKMPISPQTDEESRYLETAISPLTYEIPRYPKMPISPQTDEESRYLKTAISPLTYEIPRYSKMLISPQTDEESRYLKTAISPLTYEIPRYSKMPISPQTDEESRYLKTAISPLTYEIPRYSKTTQTDEEI
ncbi:unnamed protein product [Rhizophagus irregularis]|nr:unnamed protein product [Rhizophagus irregularis]